MILGEMKVRLGVVADTFRVKDFVKAIGDIPVSVASAITALTGMGFGFTELVKGSIDLSNNLALFRSETGKSTIELQRWGGVAEKVGLNADVVQSSIMGIQGALAAFRTGHGDPAWVMAMGQLGIKSTAGKSPFQILTEIAKSSVGRDPNVTMDLLQRARINPAMMRIFDVINSGKFAQMSKGTVIQNEADQRAMQQFQVALAEFTIAVKQSLTPALTAITPVMGDLAAVLQDVISIFVKPIVKGVGEVAHWEQLMSNKKFARAFSDFSVLVPGSANNKEFVKQTTAIVQNIYSSAEPREVARIVQEMLIHEKNKAMKQFNSGGQ